MKLGIRIREVLDKHRLHTYPYHIVPSGKLVDDLESLLKHEMKSWARKRTL